MKTEISRCLKLLQDGFSLITVGENKIPNILWKKYQTEPMDADTFSNLYMLPTTNGVGIVTGYDNLEVIDIDLKVFTSTCERQNFWNELMSFIKDNISDFEHKFVIVKTKNAGYHILYKCKKVCGNKKIAVLQGMKQAVIESRGVGGYVWIYENFVQKNNYTEIREISEEDRDILWGCCKTFNHIEPTNDIHLNKIEKEHAQANVTPWMDYNEKTDIWNLISSEFTIVRKMNDKISIKRHGALSPHSGYIFNNSKCLYLFSTGTQYPHETLLTPFHVYTHQRHNGNFSAAAKELYTLGYGSRVKKEAPVELVNTELKELEVNDFPIDIFPEHIQGYILEVHKTLNASIDYLGSSLLWVISLCVGNAIKIEIKSGWVEAGVVWIAIVGRAGIGKSHNINAMTFPLNEVNSREVKRFSEQIKRYDEYKNLTKDEKKHAIEIEEPKKTQFIVGNITMESFFDHHEQNPNGIGIFRDELSGWIKDLNQYRQGSDLETYLSCWSNQQIILTRKVSKSAYVDKAFVPILGGVQPSILSLHYTPENKDNGFIDRWLLCYPELEIEKYNENEMSERLINWYSEYIIGFFDAIKNKFVKKDNYGKQEHFVSRFNDESKVEWIRIFNKITDLQNSETENEYLKSILPKQKSYVARFALLLQCLYSYDTGEECAVISKKAILNAEKLSDYFIKMAKKNKLETMEESDIRTAIKHSGKISAQEQFIVAYEQNPLLNKAKIAEQLNVSRMTISRWINELKQKN